MGPQILDNLDSKSWQDRIDEVPAMLAEPNLDPETKARLEALKVEAEGMRQMLLAQQKKANLPMPAAANSADLAIKLVAMTRDRHQPNT